MGELQSVALIIKYVKNLAFCSACTASTALHLGYHHTNDHTNVAADTQMLQDDGIHRDCINHPLTGNIMQGRILKTKF